MRKPHAKSVLKTLPFDRQKEIFAYLEIHSLEEAEAWLAASGIDTGRSSLSSFRAWFPMSQSLHQAASMGDAVKDILRELPELNLDEHQLSKAGQAIFEAQALVAKDSGLYLALRSRRQMDRSLDLQEESGKTKAAQKARSLEQKDEEIQIAKQKYQRDTCKLYLKWFSDETAKQIASGGGTNAQKIEQLGKAMFGEDWDS